MGWWSLYNSKDVIGDEALDIITEVLTKLSHKKNENKLTLTEILSGLQVAIYQKQQHFILESNTIKINKLIAKLKLKNSQELFISDINTISTNHTDIVNQFLVALEEITVCYEDSELDRKPTLNEILVSFTYVLGYQPEQYLCISEGQSISEIVAEISMTDTTMEDQKESLSNSILSKSLPKEYQDALLKSGIQAANLLSELIELKLMPDPRAKEMADVALEVIKLVNSYPMALEESESLPPDSESQ